MFEIGCVVSFNYGGQDGTGSGILMDTVHGYVLTHGSVVSSILSKKQMFSLTTKGILQNCFDSWSASILLQKSDVEDLQKNVQRYQSSVLSNSEISSIVDSNSLNSLNNRGIIDYSAEVVAIFQLKKLKKAVSFLMPQDKWEFVEDFTKQEKPDDQSIFYPLLSCFVLLKLKNWTRYKSDLPLLKICQLNKGDNLEVEGTPFGSLRPEIFLNSRSNGVVSNKAHDLLIMTDARCVPGSEGGPVFSWRGNERYLVGIVIASLCWRSNEWVGLSMVCAIPDVLHFVRQISDIDVFNKSTVKTVMRNALSKLFEKIPMINVGSNWGSGVVIGNCHDNCSLLLTCSHVVKESGYNTVKVKFMDRTNSEKAVVVYKTPLDEHFDLAVLSVPNCSVKPVPLASTRVSQGDPVFVIGHAIFGEEKKLEPTITSGVISKIVYINNVPVMLQTTCAVHSGASGGAVVNKYGELIGIIVSNARDTISKASYPHVNMCVPMETVVPAIQKYMKSKDASVLDSLHMKNKNIKRLWSLDKVLTASKL